MTFLRRKSLGQEIAGRAQRVAGSVTGNHPREATGAFREYAGRAGSVTSQAISHAGDWAHQAAGHAGSLTSKAIGRVGTRVSRRAGVGIAIGTGLGLGALAAAYFVMRYRGRVRPEEDEHDPTRQRPTNESGDALDGSGEDNPISGSGLGF